MTRPRVLLQSSIRFAADDWHIGRFSLLAEELGRWADVTTRDRQPDATGDDPVLTGLSRDQLDEVWLIGADGGVGLSPAEVAAVNRFQAAGGGLLTVRDHCDMGHWLRGVDGVGAAHYFHDPGCCELDPERQCCDDQDTPSISWPNYHSGSNGDVEPITVVGPTHPLLRSDEAPEGHVERFPAHPHEGAVGAPPGEPRARVIAKGHSQATGRDFNLVVAFERADQAPGRAIAESSFHHFADYNWDITKGHPSFVTERESDAILRDPHLLDGIRAYVKNCVQWLAPAP